MPSSDDMCKWRTEDNGITWNCPADGRGLVHCATGFGPNQNGKRCNQCILLFLQFA